MLTTAEITAMRATSEEAMPDTGTIARPSTSTVFNPTTGVTTPGTPTVIYTGAMRVRPPGSLAELTRLFGDTEITENRYMVTVPASVDDAQVGDIVTVTDGVDPQIVGKALRVTVVPYGSWQIDRRLGAEIVE
jgi:hypothetical protein